MCEHEFIKMFKTYAVNDGTIIVLPQLQWLVLVIATTSKVQSNAGLDDDDITAGIETEALTRVVLNREHTGRTRRPAPRATENGRDQTDDQKRGGVNKE